MYEHVLPNLWMIVPREERLHLVEVFGLERTGVVEVRDQDVITDGYTYDDLSRITREAMIEYVDSDGNDSFPRLWELTTAKARSDVNPAIILNIPDGAMMHVVAPSQEEQIEQQEKVLKEYEKTDVVLQTVSDAPGHDFEPVLEVNKSEDAEVLANQTVHAKKRGRPAKQ